jgi:hypothetical protein
MHGALHLNPGTENEKKMHFIFDFGCRVIGV